MRGRCRLGASEAARRAAEGALAVIKRAQRWGKPGATDWAEVLRVCDCRALTSLMYFVAASMQYASMAQEGLEAKEREMLALEAQLDEAWGAAQHALAEQGTEGSSPAVADNRQAGNTELRTLARALRRTRKELAHEREINASLGRADR